MLTKKNCRSARWRPPYSSSEANGSFSLSGICRRRPWRFNELKKDLEGISQKVLTDSLRSMEEDGIIIRTVYPEVPPAGGVQFVRTGTIHETNP